MIIGDRVEVGGDSDMPTAGRLVFLWTGYLLFGIGLVGTVVPVLPTVVFWILAAGCFAKSSPAMYRRILAWPRVGQEVDRFLTQGAISTRGKATALAGMALGAALVLYASPGPVLTLIAMTALAFGAAYVATRPRPLAATNED